MVVLITDNKIWGFRGLENIGLEKQLVFKLKFLMLLCLYFQDKRLIRHPYFTAVLENC